MSITITNNGIWAQNGDIVAGDKAVSGDIRAEYIMETKVVRQDQLPESLFSCVTHMHGSTRTVLEVLEGDGAIISAIGSFEDVVKKHARRWVEKHRSYAWLIEGEAVDHFMLVVFYVKLSGPGWETAYICPQEDIPDVLTSNMRRQILRQLGLFPDENMYLFLKEEEYEKKKSEYSGDSWVSPTIVYNHTSYRIIQRWHSLL